MLVIIVNKKADIGVFNLRHFFSFGEQLIWDSKIMYSINKL